MGFSGWSPEAVEFFEGLRADNTRTYWNAHKGVYQASVRGPMAELLDELSGEFGPGRIARPYRDIRFRAGKSPYKTKVYATLDRGGYVRFGADGLTAALGYYMMTTAQLNRYRQAVFEPRDLTPAWVAYDPIGGMQNHVAELTRCLDRLGVAQLVVTARMAGPADRVRFAAHGR